MGNETFPKCRSPDSPFKGVLCSKGESSLGSISLLLECFWDGAGRQAEIRMVPQPGAPASQGLRPTIRRQL